MRKISSKKLNQMAKLSKEFGNLFSIKSSWYRYTDNYEKYIEEVVKQLKNEFSYVIDNYSNIDCFSPVKQKRIVWTFWWQGIDTLPEVLKMCLESHRRYIVDSDIEYIFITKDNFFKYVTIPEYIQDKLERGIISLTHFSDLLRICLLEKYGGAWIDITLLITNDLDKSIFDYDFYTINTYGSESNPNSLGQVLTRCQWTGFMFSSGGPENPLFSYVKQFLLEYWKKHDEVIDYFLLNFIFRIGFESIPLFEKMLEGVPNNNMSLYALQPMINGVYNSSIYERITSETSFFKLTQKKQCFRVVKQEESFYGHLCHLFGV